MDSFVRLRIDSCRSKRVVVFTVFLFVLTFVNCTIAQIVNNASFEGTPQMGIPPAPWFPCNPSSSPDTQPGSWGVTTSASNGNTFISLVTRGDNTMEAIGSKLNGIKPNVCYNVSIDLSASRELNFDGIFYAPVILKVWLSSGECLKTNLIWTSPMIDHTDWRSYSFNFTGSKTYSHLIMEVNYARPGAYYGAMLLDNIRFEETRITLGDDKLICEGTTVKLNADKGWEKITWSDGGQEYIHEVDKGIYWVQVQSQNCVLRDTVTVNSQPLINLKLPEKIKLCAGGDTLLNVASTNAKYLWSNGSTEASLKIKEAGNHWVEVSTVCETVKKEILISTRENCCDINLPNVFTPNNDTVNDFLTVSTESNVARYDLQVFNRWGGLVYESKTIHDFWNGLLNNGNEAASGVYYYTIQLMCIENNKIIDANFKGPISVIR
jgi:gliding motility-associated-like protein